MFISSKQKSALKVGKDVERFECTGEPSLKPSRPFVPQFEEMNIERTEKTGEVTTALSRSHFSTLHQLQTMRIDSKESPVSEKQMVLGLVVQVFVRAMGLFLLAVISRLAKNTRRLIFHPSSKMGALPLSFSMALAQERADRSSGDLESSDTPLSSSSSQLYVAVLEQKTIVPCLHFLVMYCPAYLPLPDLHPLSNDRTNPPTPHSTLQFAVIVCDHIGVDETPGVCAKVQQKHDGVSICSSSLSLFSAWRAGLDETVITHFRIERGELPITADRFTPQQDRSKYFRQKKLEGTRLDRKMTARQCHVAPTAHLRRLRIGCDALHGEHHEKGGGVHRSPGERRGNEQDATATNQKRSTNITNDNTVTPSFRACSFDIFLHFTLSSSSLSPLQDLVVMSFPVSPSICPQLENETRQFGETVETICTLFDEKKDSGRVGHYEWHKDSRPEQSHRKQGKLQKRGMWAFQLDIV
ncbi:hypothetical protein BLNAU_10804 [Blattamonas nauphoetae]|uniref:Uncharacterized protein n=1 Tax=Blattamonas nauphoetae TaxID=2049346 RepID=A0ABQ9XRJ2_9EUKA|nr:hypothetical protein BLNAU_10804 [Blattamonas nauphoetae]